MNVLLQARLFLVLDKEASRFTRAANFDKFVTNIHHVIYYVVNYFILSCTGKFIYQASALHEILSLK